MTTKILSYTQDRPADYLREHPEEKWRCDIYPSAGGDHHGVGHDEVEAIQNALSAWVQYNNAKLAW